MTKVNLHITDSKDDRTLTQDKTINRKSAYIIYKPFV